MQGDKLVPKKIAESSIAPPIKRVLAEIYQYETERGKRSGGPYKDYYRELIQRGAREVVITHED